jgi:hypothetical protein
MVISLGAGVQSTTLLLMAVAGELPVTPELALFADTGWEPRATYEHLARLEEAVGDRIEIVRVQGGDIRRDTMAAAAGEGNRFASIPLYVTNHQGGEGTLRRQCTREFKLEPIYRELRRRGYRQVDVALGITMDEIQRMKPSRVKWARNVWPLLDARMRREDCVRWLAEHDHPTPPKSACIGCPFHGDAQWRDLRDNRPDEWADAVEFDAAIRRLPRIDGEAFLHRQRVPLDQVDLTTPEDHGQLALDQMDECEGGCFL